MKIFYWNIFRISYNLKRSLHKKCLKNMCSLIWSTAQWFTETKRRIWENWVSANAISSNNPLSWPCCAVAFLQELAISPQSHNPTIPQSQSLVLSCISSQQATVTGFPCMCKDGQNYTITINPIRFHQINTVQESISSQKEGGSCTFAE